jgi:hypothetical protein
VDVLGQDCVDAVFELAEQFTDLGMVHGSAGIVHQQILLGYVGDVGGLLVFRQRMIGGGVRSRPLWAVSSLPVGQV